MQPALALCADSPPSVGVGRALFVAGVAAALLAGSVGGEPLPSSCGAAGFLALAVFFDVWRRRIPNALTAPAFAAALLAALVGAGPSGLLAALAGAGTVIGLLFLPFAARALGAGDVKAMAVLGALFGPHAALELLLASVFSAGAIAVMLLAARGGLAECAARWHAAFTLTVLSRRLYYVAPAADSAARGSFAFAPALALGFCAWSGFGIPCL